MCCFFMSFCIKKYKNILIFIFLGGINMAVKTGVSMISFVITKEMRRDRLHELQCKLKERQAGSNHKGK